MLTKMFFGWAFVLLAVFSVGRAQDTTEVVKPDSAESVLRIRIASVFVDDQDKAERFYTEVLGFVKKSDVPVGEYRWLTVVSAEAPDGAELLLEPTNNPAARAFQAAIYDQGIPATVFFVEDVDATYERLRKEGVTFTQPPTDAGNTILAVFDDTCGNLIQIVQEQR